jgi:hypothetical protein
MLLLLQAPTQPCEAGMWSALRSRSLAGEQQQQRQQQQQQQQQSQQQKQQQQILGR